MTDNTTDVTLRDDASLSASALIERLLDNPGAYLIMGRTDLLTDKPEYFARLLGSGTREPGIGLTPFDALELLCELKTAKSRLAAMAGGEHD